MSVVVLRVGDRLHITRDGGVEVTLSTPDGDVIRFGGMSEVVLEVIEPPKPKRTRKRKEVPDAAT